MKKIALILLISALWIGFASAGQSPRSSPGVGDYASDFSLVDVRGNVIRLSDFKGKKSVALIFYADHGWPPSLKQLGGLQDRITEIEKLNLEIVAISTAGDQQNVESTRRLLGITYILIPKPNRRVVEAYGLEYDPYGAAYATFLIDKKGRIRFKSVNEPNDLTWPSKIMRELQGI